MPCQPPQPWLQPLAIQLNHLTTEPAPIKPDDQEPRRIIRAHAPSSSGRASLLGENGGSEPCPTPAISAAAKRWNESPASMIRLAAAFFCFLVMGATDAAYGLQSYYHLSYIVVSLVFLSPVIGYVSSALLSNHLHHKLGQRGVAVICGGCHVAAYTIIVLHPPYTALVFAFVLAGFGNGVADAAWNAWVGNLANSSELLGVLHAFYGAGSVVSPLIATALVTKADLPWFSFYYIMIGLAAVETVSLAWAFWESSGAEYRQLHRTNELENETGLTDALFKMPSARVSWVAALFLFCLVGIEVALGGWIVVFMLRVRNGGPFASGMSAVGFWLGVTVGSATLGFVTPRLGVKLSTGMYIGATAGLELIFWLVPQFYVSAVAVAFQGFFLGPLFPNAIFVASRLLPRQHHVVVIGFASAFGGCGAAVIPFVTGMLAQAQDPKVLQPIVLSLLFVMLGIWFCFPRIDKKKE
uniref:Major facilitator superfamily protein homeolog p n=1 Tax=Epichloe coenophiala TaxID=5047 RepID=A0A346R948_EPICN|nr:major facilitator superfamily protein homeolog p [Epichloe coenophiala]